MEFSAAIGETFAAVFQAIDVAPLEAPLRATPKIDLPVSGACSGGGTASVDQSGDVITVTLTDCVGTGIAADPVSGDAALTILDTGSNGLLITAMATIDLKIGLDTVVVGDFIASVDLARIGQIHLRLGDALDGDLLRVTESGQTTLVLGCFDFRLAFEQLGDVLQLFRITPYGVASLRNQEEMKNEVFTINDYTPRVTGIGRSINFDDDGLPGSGEMMFLGGDHSAVDTDRAEEGKTLCLLGEAGDTSVTATFSAGGCVDLQGEDKDGPFQNSTTWDKLIDRDFTSGSGGGCGGGENLICDELPADAVVERRIADSDFQDSNWQVEVVATEGAMYDAPVVRQESSGVDNSAFRHMTHSIEDATNCAESCTVSVVHTIAETYDPDPAADGPIAFINYTEAQKVITPGFDGAAVGWAFAVVQDGRRFNGPVTTAFTVTGWTTNGLCGLTQDDFGPADGPHPNFSGGGALSFAYIRSNSNTSEVAAITNVHGIDDFEVVIVKE
jgi:hypothetical protein